MISTLVIHFLSIFYNKNISILVSELYTYCTNIIINYMCGLPGERLAFKICKHI